MPTLTAQSLYAVCHLVASRMGSADAEAAEVADHLLHANLSGHDSHGIGMLPAYVRLLRLGFLVPNQTPVTVLDSGALLVIDARRGYGPRMAADAVRRAIVRAKEIGACVLALRNSAHIGRIGAYGEQAARAGCVFTAFANVANVRAAAAPFGCADARLGTNPFCTAIPGPDGVSVLLDMATTTIAHGKARIAFNKGEPVPEGTLLDAAGVPTTDPAPFIRDRKGALVTFGQHKGSGLAVLCEMMAAAVGGGQRGDEKPKGGVMNSMLATVIDMSKLGDPAAIDSAVEATKAHIRSSRVASGFDEILLPGEPERRSADARRRNGIPVDDTTWRDVCAAAATLGVTDAEMAGAAGAND